MKITETTKFLITFDILYL